MYSKIYYNPVSSANLCGIESKFELLIEQWKEKSTTDNFGYKNKRKEWLPPLAYRVGNVVTNTPAGANNYTYHCYKLDPYNHLPGLIFETNAVAIATTKAYGSLGRIKKASLAVSIAEAKKSMELVASTATKLANSARYLRKLQFSKLFQELNITKKKLPKPLKRKYRVKTMSAYRRKRYMQLRKTKVVSNMPDALADFWLELQFGWMPMVSDIKNTYEGVIDILYLQRPPMFRIVGSSKEIHDSMYNGNYGNQKYGCDMTQSATIIQYFGINNYPAFNANTMGLTNPLAVAWELVPFSFIVDWFLPIQNYIEAHTALIGLSWYGGCLSVKTERDFYGVADGGDDKKCSMYGKARTFSRTAPYHLTEPEFPSLSFDDTFSFWKVTTSMALLRKYFR